MPSEISKSKESKLHSAFELLQEKSLVSYEFDPTVRGQMEQAQNTLFEKAKGFWCDKLDVIDEKSAPAKETNEADAGNPLDMDDECQRLLFFPLPSDMRLFVRALMKDITASQMKLVSMLYSLHVKDAHLLEAFVQYGGMIVLERYLRYKESPHIMSQAMDIFMNILSIPQISNMASAIQNITVQTVSTDDEKGWAEQRRLLTQDFKFWPQFKKVIFEADLLDALESTIMAGEDLYPNSRAHAAKLLGFVTQVFIQPFYNISKDTKEKRKVIQSGKVQLTGQKLEEAYPHENLRLPKKMYIQLLYMQGDAGASDSSADYEVLINLLEFFEDFTFSRQKLDEELERFEENSVLYKMGKGDKPGGKHASSNAKYDGYVDKMKPSPWMSDKDEKLSCSAYFKKQLIPNELKILSKHKPVEVTADNLAERLIRDLVYHVSLFKQYGNLGFSNRNYNVAENCYSQATDFSLVKLFVKAIKNDDIPTAEIMSAMKSTMYGRSYEGLGPTESGLEAHEEKICLKTDTDYDDAFEIIIMDNRDLLGKELAVIHANRANSLLKMGRIPESIEMATLATELDPKYVKGYFRLAEAYKSKKDIPKAIEWINKASALAPKDKSILQLKDSLENLNNLESAD